MLNALFIYLIVIHHFVPEILITVCVFGMREIDFLAMNLHVYCSHVYFVNVIYSSDFLMAWMLMLYFILFFTK